VLVRSIVAGYLCSSFCFFFSSNPSCHRRFFLFFLSTASHLHHALYSISPKKTLPRAKTPSRAPTSHRTGTRRATHPAIAPPGWQVIQEKESYQKKKRNGNNKKERYCPTGRRVAIRLGGIPHAIVFFLLFAPTPGCASFPRTGARRFPHWLASRGPVRSPRVVIRKGKFKKQKQRKLKQRVHTEKIDPHRAITPHGSHRALLAP
jgi:hypothetical protein